MFQFFSLKKIDVKEYVSCSMYDDIFQAVMSICW